MIFTVFSIEILFYYQNFHFLGATFVMLGSMVVAAAMNLAGDPSLMKVFFSRNN